MTKGGIEVERSPIKVLHYINQFFGGIGGEEKADVGVQVYERPIGPGRVLEETLADRGSVIATIVCGDDYAVEQEQLALEDVKDALQRFVPDVVVAGPAFNSGRYGIACARVCMTAQSQGIPAVTGMFPDNAGVITYGREIVAVPTGTKVIEIKSILKNMATLALKLGSGEKLGPAEEEGYIPRGFRRPVMRDKVGYERALDMLKARIEGRAFVSEIPMSQYETVSPAAPITNLADATIAFVVSTGIVPKNNPDRMPSYRATEAFRYSIEGLHELKVEEWGSVHGGFNTAILNKVNPNYGLPLPALRKLEAQGVIKKIHPYFYSTVGNSTFVDACKGIGAKVAQELKSAGVGGVLEVAG